MISIGVAIADEFTTNSEADCTNFPICTVTILERNRRVNLVLMPTSDSAVENSERWTASLVDSSNYNFAARNNNVAFDITDPPTPGPMMPSLPVVGIATSDMPMEGGAGVTLTITSSETVPATLIGGLTVTIDITGADAADIQPNADCTAFPRCIVTIPAGSDSVSLILSPLSDFSTETESWTASLRDGSDFNLAANFNVDFAITDLIAAVGIMTSNTGIEGGAAVTLTITSSEAVPAALTDGLSVIINIVGADNTDFTSAACTNTQCVITIPIGMTAGTLTIMASTDSDAEGGSETWTATIAPDTDNNIFMVDSNADDAVFAVGNMLPPVVDGTMLMALNDYTPPTVLAADAIRAGEDSVIAANAITGLLYNDAAGNPQIYVQLLTYAHLGIWTNGQVPTVITSPTAMASDFVNDFRYAFLGDNAVSSLPTSGTANYAIEGDATYKGVNFFPDGIITANFALSSFGILISAEGDSANRADDFGNANAMVPDGSGGMRPMTTTDNISIDFTGTIVGNEFQGTPIFTVDGFFSDLAGFDSAASSFSGRFYDSATYNPAATLPRELAGVMEIVDDQGNLNMGFLGRRP